MYTLAFDDWRQAKNEDEKKVKLEAVRQMRDKVVQFFTSQAQPIMVEDIEARTALAEGNANGAASRFEALLKKIPDPTQEMYFTPVTQIFFETNQAPRLDLLIAGLSVIQISRHC